MPNGKPQDRFFSPILTFMIYSYCLPHVIFPRLLFVGFALVVLEVTTILDVAILQHVHV